MGYLPISTGDRRISEPSTVGGDFIFEGFHLDSYETVGFHSTKMPSSPWSCQKKTQKKPIGLRKITIAFWNPRLKSMEKAHAHACFVHFLLECPYLNQECSSYFREGWDKLWEVHKAI